ncbi:EspF repeat-containing protein [Nonomuraea fuscirosea]|uniref:EspF repeat-containing protein n=1 Tax=Nonomuraea fuscirosea TaxID=1291556 RepID=UPI003433C2EF
MRRRADGAGGRERLPGQGVGTRCRAGGQPPAPGARPAAERPRQTQQARPDPDVRGRLGGGPGGRRHGVDGDADQVGS